MVRKTLNTSRWKRLRNYVMARDGYRCQESLRYGQSVQAEMVHHIYPVREYPELGICSLEFGGSIELSTQQDGIIGTRMKL